MQIEMNKGMFYIQPVEDKEGRGAANENEEAESSQMEGTVSRSYEMDDVLNLADPTERSGGRHMMMNVGHTEMQLVLKWLNKSLCEKLDVNR